MTPAAWVDVGRVNTWQRFAAFAGLADTVDGTVLAFDQRTPVAAWSAHQPIPGVVPA